tara:strand:+ start:894 stop:1070 length:177 start_codon:yes stop_codon:yes gene_type:complete
MDQEIELTNNEHKNLIAFYSQTAREIRRDKGQDPGMTPAYHPDSQPVELDPNQSFVIT